MARTLQSIATMTNTASLVTALASTLLISLPASAKPNTNGLSDSARATLQSFKIYMKDCTPEKAPKGISDCSRIIKSQQKRLARIKGPDRKHSLYKEYAAYQARLEKAHAVRLAADKQKRKRASALVDRASAMRKVIEKHTTTLWFLDSIDKKKPIGQADFGAITAKRRLAAVGALGEFARDCKKAYAPVLEDKDVLWHATSDRAPSPADACALAADAKSLLRAWFPRVLAAHIRHNAGLYESEIAAIRTRGTASNNILAALESKQMKAYVAEQVAAYKPTAAKVGGRVSAKDFASWVKLAKTAPKAIKKAGKTKRKRPTAKNSKVTRATKKRMRGTKLAMKKLGLSSKQGRIVKTAGGRPLRQVWTGALLTKTRGESFCRQYAIKAVAQYKGGGRYLAPVVTLPGRTFQIAACR